MVQLRSEKAIVVFIYLGFIMIVSGSVIPIGIFTPDKKPPMESMLMFLLSIALVALGGLITTIGARLLTICRSRT